jgi:hypothetical protein
MPLRQHQRGGSQIYPFGRPFRHDGGPGGGRREVANPLILVEKSPPIALARTRSIGLIRGREQQHRRAEHAVDIQAVPDLVEPILHLSQYRDSWSFSGMQK